MRSNTRVPRASLCRLPRRSSRFFTAVLLAIGAVLSTSAAWAGTVTPYGNFVGPNVSYLGVTEGSITDPLPLYGAPTLDGDSLKFNPTNFSAQSSGGGIDITDGQYTSMVVSSIGGPLLNVSIAEMGTFSLTGTGTNNTAAGVSTPVTVTVLMVNGADITPISFQQNLLVAPSPGIYGLSSNPGANQNWSSSAFFDLGSLLAGAGINGDTTKLTLTFNNTLVASSEPLSSAAINKSMIKIMIGVPEPSSLLLAGLGAAMGAVACVRRRKA